MAKRRRKFEVRLPLTEIVYAQGYEEFNTVVEEQLRDVGDLSMEDTIEEIVYIPKRVTRGDIVLEVRAQVVPIL